MRTLTIPITLAVLVVAATGLPGQTRIRSLSVPTLKTLGGPQVGPAPQGIGFASPATYGVFARLTWNAAPNVSSYLVSRGKMDDPACCNATSGLIPGNATSWDDAGLYRPGPYQYTLQANYADGSVGTTGIGLTVLSGVAPTPITVEDVVGSPGKVRITWNLNLYGVNAIKISGPGVAGGYGVQGEKLVPGGGPIDLFLPAGTHSWKVATAYDVTKLPFPLATNYGTTTAYGTTYVVPAPQSEWATVSHTVNIRSNRFRISLERFEAIATAGEDFLRGDGRGNEVYILTQVNEYRYWGRSGNTLASTRMLRTPTFGDVHNYPGRVRAGSASPTGGIQAKDEYPAAVQLVSQLQPPTTANLPFHLWEGDLTEIDGALILSPSIWEADEDERLVPYYQTFQLGIANNLQYTNTLNPFMPWRAGTNLWRPVRCPSMASGTSRFVIPQLSGWGDEPVDMVDRQSYCPTFVVINWSLAHSYTSVNPAAVVEIPLAGSPPWGQYKLYLRIERR